MQNLRVCVYEAGAGDRLGSVVEDRVYDLNLCCAQQLSAEKGALDSYRLANNLVPRDLGAFLAGGHTLSAARDALSWALSAGAQEGPSGEPLYHGARDVKLKAPIIPSTKVICLGDVYISHLAIGGSPIPDTAGLFYKMSQVVVGPEEWVVIPKHHTGPVVYGTELTLVIGKAGRSIPEDRVEDHIWGYTIFNDVTLGAEVTARPHHQGVRYQCARRALDRAKGPDRRPSGPEAEFPPQRQAGAGRLHPRHAVFHPLHGRGSVQVAHLKSR